MKWDELSKTEEGLFNIPQTWIYPKHYELLNLLFRIENGLRIFVYAILKNKYGDKWANISLKTEDGADGTIGSLARRRIAQDLKHGYLGAKSEAIVMYLTSGELIRIISDHEWSEFKKFFDADQAIVKLKLEEISNIRNALSHFRTITDQDIGVVKQNTAQIFSKISKYIQRLVGTFADIPENDQSTYYSSLHGLIGGISSTVRRDDQHQLVSVALKIELKGVVEGSYGEGYYRVQFPCPQVASLLALRQD